MEIQAHGLKVTVLKLGRKSSYLGGRRLRVFFFSDSESRKQMISTPATTAPPSTTTPATH